MKASSAMPMCTKMCLRPLIITVYSWKMNKMLTFINNNKSVNKGVSYNKGITYHFDEVKPSVVTYLVMLKVNKIYVKYLK